MDARIDRALCREEDLEVPLVVGHGASRRHVLVPGIPPARLGSHHAGAGDGILDGAACDRETRVTLERAGLPDHVAEAEHLAHGFQRYAEIGPLVFRRVGE